jgi:hypothetical protein
MLWARCSVCSRCGCSRSKLVGEQPRSYVRGVSELVDWAAPERNKQPILDVLARILPARGMVLEVASATGQHIAHFARALPHLTWQPTDCTEEHLQHLAARRAHVELPNLLPALFLDVTSDEWPVSHVAAVYNANMIHISPWETTLGLFRGAARVLSVGAPLVTYGPYSVAGRHISESNAEFHASLRARDPLWGVRDVTEVAGVAEANGFALEEQVAMPANNLTLIWRRTH